MAIFKSYSDLVTSFLEYLRLVQPELDTKPGTVSRDIVIDSPSKQLSELYVQLRNISNLQSFFSTSGSDLVKLGSNFGIQKRSGTAASGTAVLTTNNLDVDTLIQSGEIILANNGISFRVINNYLMSVANINSYKATALRLRNELDLAGITDEIAIEIVVEAVTTGSSGNIGIYSLSSHSISGISNVTNLQSFTGGTDQESDNSYKTRVLSVFAGSNTGTSLGYITATEAVSGVQDSAVIVPGDPLLTRDGTQVTTDSSGNLVVSSAGTGGKVDIYVLGNDLSSQVDTFIYNDLSGKHNPADPANDVVLGQQGQSTSLNVSQRRVNLISSGILPYQPVTSIASVVGSSSGSNFVEKYTENGQEKGNYELIKDSGDFGGSPFGFDKLRWISDKIELNGEDVVKGIFNGTDEVTYSDIIEIREITQDFSVTNENSTSSSSDRSSISLKHAPIRNVGRVVNLTTGERYIIDEQNPDGNAGELNTTGRIVISGNTLPVGADILQVDYTWVKSFDPLTDFDNLKDYNINRSVQDSIDWSFGNLITNEPAVVEDDGYGNISVEVTHPIYKVISVNSFSSGVFSVSSSTITIDEDISNVINIKRVSDGAELYNTDARDGSLSGTDVIILPSDSIAEDGDSVLVKYNSSDIFIPDGYDTGTFVDKIITIPTGASVAGTNVLVNYVANISTLLPEIEISNLPAVASGNYFSISNVEVGDQPTSNLYDGGGNISCNLRRAYSNLKFNVGSIVSSGSITIYGTSIKKLSDVLVTVTSGSGYEINLQSAIISDLSVTSLPTAVKAVRLCSVERVNLDNSGEISSVDNTYDIVNYKVNDNSYDLDVALSDSSLGNARVVLPQTSNNTDYILSAGDILRVTFYYINSADSELLYFSKNGIQVTNKIFSNVSRIHSSYGFKNPSEIVVGNVTVSNYNQPADNSSYSVGYDYTAPKENERITITFNYNSLINTVTNAIEEIRPITADVLIKQAKVKNISVNIRIILLPEFETQSQTVIQNAKDAVMSFLTSTSLGTTIDSSDVVSALYSVSGIDRVRVLNFSYEGSGNLLSISADKNEYLSAGTVDIQVEAR